MGKSKTKKEAPSNSLEKKTWLQQRVDWMENHRIAGPILLVVFVMTVIGGIVSFVEKGIEITQLVLKEPDSIAIKMQIQNISTNTLTIDPICETEIIEEGRNRTSYYGEAHIRLTPKESSNQTNQFFLGAGQRRDYDVKIADNQTNRELLERQTGTIKLKVWTTHGGVLETNVPFTRETLRNGKVILSFAN